MVRLALNLKAWELNDLFFVEFLGSFWVKHFPKKTDYLFIYVCGGEGEEGI